MRLLWLQGGVSKEEVLDKWVLEAGRNEHEAAIEQVRAVHVDALACAVFCVPSAPHAAHCLAALGRCKSSEF
jgi:hypothetical protein